MKTWPIVWMRRTFAASVKRYHLVQKPQEGMDMKLPKIGPDEQLAKSFVDKMMKKMTEGSKIIVMK